MNFKISSIKKKTKNHQYLVRKIIEKNNIFFNNNVVFSTIFGQSNFNQFIKKVKLAESNRNKEK